ncbi:MAG: hypothetical protein JXR97_12380 [Planctomycetes bacterium]|nr:hypothetical protein [Planctomycetota bacterium]
MFFTSILVGCSPDNAPPARHAATRVITNGILSVEVMDPTSSDRYNNGVRFCSIGAVLRASMGGHEFFYNPVTHNRKSDHGGLASEFDLCIPGGPANDFPPGYHEAKPGEGFLKIGIGVLKKQNKPYSLFQSCDLISPAENLVTWGRQGASFIQKSKGVNGFAYELRADVILKGNNVTVEWALKNTGVKPFSTKQYTHNFFRFDEYDVGPGYLLTFPYDINPRGQSARQQVVSRSIEFKEFIPKWVNIDVPYPNQYTGPNAVVLSYPTKGLSIKCETSVAGIKTAIHARPVYISPEQFIEIKLEPSQTERWTRTYVLHVDEVLVPYWDK